MKLIDLSTYHSQDHDDSRYNTPFYMGEYDFWASPAAQEMEIRCETLIPLHFTGEWDFGAETLELSYHYGLQEVVNV